MFRRILCYNIIFGFIINLFTPLCLAEDDGFNLWNDDMVWEKRLDCPFTNPPTQQMLTVEGCIRIYNAITESMLKISQKRENDNLAFCRIYVCPVGQRSVKILIISSRPFSENEQKELVALGRVGASIFRNELGVNFKEE